MSAILLRRCFMSKGIVTNRGMAAVASDSIQKLFVDKINEYKTKEKSTPDGLVDVDPSVRKALQEEMQRVKRTYNVKDGEEAKIVTTFKDDEFTVDSIKMKDWK